MLTATLSYKLEVFLLKENEIENFFISNFKTNKNKVVMNFKIKLKSLFLLCTMCFVFTQFVNGQGKQKFLFTKGDNNISVITIGSTHCTVIEYPKFLVVHEIPNLPKNEQDDNPKTNPLITFIDSVYLKKPIKYILNSHHHSHSLSTITPFLEKGAKLITAKENIKRYDKRGLFGDKTSEGYSASIIQISSDTVLLSETKIPIEILYLKKSDYKSIPTETYLFFNFTQQKLLATSCMVYLLDFNEKHGFKGTIYSDRITDVNKIIKDRNLEVENTLQLYNFRFENEVRKLPIFSLSYLQNVIKHGWHRNELSEYFQNMSYEELATKQDSLLNFLVEYQVYSVITNRAVYELINKKEYQKAVALAQLQVLYRPDVPNFVDTLGEAYFNNGDMLKAKYFDKIIRKIKPDDKRYGLIVWEKNQKDRLKNDS